jgi:MFS family permease
LCLTVHITNETQCIGFNGSSLPNHTAVFGATEFFGDGSWATGGGDSRVHQLAAEVSTDRLECEWDEGRRTCAKDPSVLSLVFVAFGLGDVLGGVVLGRLSDGASPLWRKLVVSVGAVAYLVALWLTWGLKQLPSEHAHWPLGRPLTRSAPCAPAAAAHARRSRPLSAGQ